MSLDQEIYNTAIEEGFSPISAKLIVAQARLESGDYDSNVFHNNNNMFGMKYVGQPLAKQGTLSPEGDYYAKYDSPSDSARDVIQRLYKKTRKGVGFEELRNVKDADEYAQKLKQRDYFGADWEGYAKGLKAKLRRIQIVEFYNKYKKTIDYSAIGILLIILSSVSFWYYKKNFK